MESELNALVVGAVVASNAAACENCGFCVVGCGRGIKRACRALDLSSGICEVEAWVAGAGGGVNGEALAGTSSESDLITDGAWCWF